MKVRVQVKPQRRLNSVQATGDGLIVELRAVPEDGKANAALVCVLADHFNVKKSQVRIISGHTSRIKLVEIENGSA